MSLTVITCDECGAYANIRVNTHQKTEYCNTCNQAVKEYSEEKWLCFSCAAKWLVEKAEKNRELFAPRGMLEKSGAKP